MKLLLKILFFVFAIFQTNICEAKVLLFGEVVTQIRFIENAIENKNEATINSENEIAITCKSESDLLDYRNWALSIGAVASKGGIANSRALGIAGEQAVGIGLKTRIPSLTGTAKYRIPDQLTSTTLGEVKNVRHLSLTRQLTDFHMFSQQTGRQFILHTRPNTTFSGPLQNLINNGSIITKPIPFK